MPQGKTQSNISSTAPRAGHTSAAEHIYAELHRRIIVFDLPPGVQISKNDIAVEFGVSGTPVRDALMRLELEGLVNIFPQSRTTVSLIDVQNARDIEFLRVSVEVEIIRQLANSITQDGLKELSNWILRQEMEIATGDDLAFKVADDQFHRCLFQLAGAHRLISIINSQRGHYDRIRQLYFPEHADLSVILEEHRAIVAALEQHDEHAAEAAFRAHLRRSFLLIDTLREKHADYFL